MLFWQLLIQSIATDLPTSQFSIRIIFIYAYTGPPRAVVLLATYQKYSTSEQNEFIE